jgi:exodeoxyribonuclease V alpha subunit
VNRTVPATISVGLTVKSLVAASELGGAIFGAHTSSGDYVRVVASGRAIHRPPVPGETWEVTGEFRHAVEYGQQLHARQCIYQAPRGRLLVQYLANNPAFVGIGEVKARALFDEFADDLVDVLSSGDIERLSQVLTRETSVRLVGAWAEQRAEAELIDYLDTRGFTPRLAGQLRRAWGAKALDVLDRNPYFMLAFATWRTVDAAARLTGVQPDDPRRLVGAVEAALYKELQAGHTLTDRDTLLSRVRRLLGNGSHEKALTLALQEGANVGDEAGGYQPVGAAALEARIAERVRNMLAGERARQGTLFGEGNVSKSIDARIAVLEREQGFALSETQRYAVEVSSTSAFSLLIGGAGVGKTTVLRAVVAVAQEQGAAVHQMALSGRAAKRMAEATYAPATTIAKFLTAIRAGKLELDESTLLVVDEASMLDLPTMFRLLRHLPDGARMLLVGDPAQLPPIGFGLVFHRLAETAGVPRVELTEVHRQAASTGIPAVAAAIRRHDVPAVSAAPEGDVGVSFIECQPTEILDAIERVVSEWEDDWQVLAAVKDGPGGIRAINEHFHAQRAGAACGNGFAIGDPVIHLVNDYDAGLMNGTLGFVMGASEGLEKGLWVDFEGEEHLIPQDDLAERLELAYAISVHKAQGSQFKRVVIVISESRILDHALVYTALTRGVRQVVFVGDRAAFERAVREAPLAQRRRTAFAV